MYFDLEELKSLAGVDQLHSTGETHLDEFNPRKMATLTEQIRRAEPGDDLNMIYNWVRAGTIDTLQFKNLLQTQAEKTDES